MPISRYNSPAYSNYVSTYVPIPFEELAMAGAAKQREYEKNESIKDSFLTQIGQYQDKIHSSDLPAYQKRADDVRGKISNLIESTPDIGSYEFKRGLNKVVNEVASDPWWSNAINNANTYSANQQEYNKQRSNNKDYNYIDSGNIYNKFEQYGTEGIGRLPNFSYTEYKDVGKYLVDYADKLKSDSKLSKYTDASGNWNITSGTSGRFVEDLYDSLGIIIGKDNDGNKSIVDVNIPSNIVGSQEFSNLVNQAKQYSEQTGEDQEDVLKALYADHAIETANLLAHKETRYEKELTSLGSDRAKKADENKNYTQFYGNADLQSNKHQNVNSDEIISNIQGWSSGVDNAIRINNTYGKEVVKTPSFSKSFERFFSGNSENKYYINNLLSSMYGIQDIKLVDNLPIDRQKEISNGLSNAISSGNVKSGEVSPFIQNIDPEMNYIGGKGSKGLTNTIFGSESLKKGSSFTGDFGTRYFIKEGSDEKPMTGIEFSDYMQKQISKSGIKEVPISIQNEFSYNQNLPEITGIKQFSKAYAFTVGGEKWIMSEAPITRVEKNGLQYDKSLESSLKHNIWSALNNSNISSYIDPNDFNGNHVEINQTTVPNDRFKETGINIKINNGEPINIDLSNPKIQSEIINKYNGDAVNAILDIIIQLSDKE